MRPHRTDHQTAKPHTSVMHALMQRLGGARTEARAHARAEARPLQPVQDLRDLDQRVREIGEW